MKTFKTVAVTVVITIVVMFLVFTVIFGGSSEAFWKTDTDEPIHTLFADCVSCETGTVFTKNIDVKEHIYYGEEYEFNILDAEVKDGTLILYRAHGEPVIFSLKSD